MKTSQVYHIIGAALMLMSLLGVFLGQNQLAALIGVLMSNVWIVGAQIMRKLGD